MSQEWYTYPITQQYGSPDSGNGGIENGIDIGVPYGTTITSPFSGVITAIQQDPWGGTITMKLNGMPSWYQGLPQVFGYVTHLDTFASGLKVGSTVNIGDVIGTSGGQVTGGNMPSGSYSTGPHIELGFTSGPAFGHGSAFQTGPNSDPLLNPTQYYLGLITNGITGGAVSAGATTVGNTAGSILSFLQSILNGDFLQRGIIIVVSIAFLIIGVLVLFKGGSSSIVNKQEVAS